MPNNSVFTFKCITHHFLCKTGYNFTLEVHIYPVIALYPTYSLTPTPFGYLHPWITFDDDLYMCTITPRVCVHITSTS